MRALWASLGLVGLWGCAPAGPSCPSAPLRGAVTATVTETGGVLSGWVADDAAGPPVVQIYVDGAPLQRLLAGEPSVNDSDRRRPFRWAFGALGPGPGPDGAHEVAVYGNGRDCQGHDDGAVELDGSPLRVAAGCAGLPQTAAAFCALAPGYFQRRSRDSALVGDAGNGAVGAVSRAYGGAVLQLRQATAAAIGDNLLAEHGAYGVQTVVEGRGLRGDVIDPAYGYEGATRPCDGAQDPPGRVAQAQGAGCGFDPPGTTRVACWSSDEHATPCIDFADTFRTVTADPFHSTRQGAAVVGLEIAQWLRAVPGGLRLRQRLRYDGAQRWAAQAQELPQIVSADGIAGRVYSYLGSRPFAGDAVSTLTLPAAGEVLLRLPGFAEDRYPPGPSAGTAREGWWCVCDDSDARCLTIASLGPLPEDDEAAEAPVHSAVRLGRRAGGAVLSPLGVFGLGPGLSLGAAVYLFPYRYDEPIAAAGGRTPRALINALAPTAFRERAGR